MRIALLDDNPQDSALLEQYLRQFCRERGQEMQVDTYYAGLDLLEEYEIGYDVVFLDIEMPGISGMEVAREIRQTDDAVGIIFITNMAQYALQGYEVNAIDFMVKPVGYFNFARKLERAIRFVQQREERYLLLSNEEGASRIRVSEIRYVEKSGNYVRYHTGKGIFPQRNTIKAVKVLLGETPFSECMSGYLVNLHYVDQIGADSIQVEAETLPLSRRMKKKFTQDFVDYLGGGI